MTPVRAATWRDVEACTRVLSRSFHADPGTAIFEPDPVRRAAILPAFFRMFVEASLDEGGDLVVGGDPVVGLASWFGPDRHGPSDEAMAARGLDAVVEVFGPAAAARMLAMTAEIERQHEARIAGPHLRLEFFGVDPEAQGRGIGGALIAVGHERADRDGLRCWLETFTDEDVRFYRHRGYDVVGSYLVGDGVPMHALIREPAGTARGDVARAAQASPSGRQAVERILDARPPWMSRTDHRGSEAMCYGQMASDAEAEVPVKGRVAGPGSSDPGDGSELETPDACCVDA